MACGDTEEQLQINASNHNKHVPDIPTVTNVGVQIRQGDTSRTTPKQLVKTDSTNDSNARYITLHWSEGEGEFLTALGGAVDVAPAKLIENESDFSLVEVAQLPSFLAGTAENAKTYKIKGKRIEASLTAEQEKTVYLIGEAHIGDSQIRVAKALTDLLRDRELDAIMVEQPSDGKIDWSDFAELESRSDQVIANLQAVLLKDSSDYSTTMNAIAPIRKLQESPRGKRWFDFLSKVDSGTTVVEVVSEITREQGEDAAIDFTSYLKERSEVYQRLVNDTANSAALERYINLMEDYESNLYLSATDYAYAMLNLKGVNIPFYFVEDRAEREYFHRNFTDSRERKIVNRQLLRRDRAMVKNLSKVFADHGYRQAALIIGAAHTENLIGLLRNAGFTPIVYYQEDYDQNIKPELAISKNPSKIKELAKRSTSSVASNEFIVENKPSVQLEGTVSESLRQLQISSSEISAILREFTDIYVDNGYRSSPSWSVKVTLPNNKGTVSINKSVRANRIIVELESNQLTQLKPASNTDLTALYEATDPGQLLAGMRRDFESTGEYILRKDTKEVVICCFGEKKIAIKSSNYRAIIPLIYVSRQAKNDGELGIRAVGFSQKDMDSLIKVAKQERGVYSGFKDRDELIVLTAEGGRVTVSPGSEKPGSFGKNGGKKKGSAGNGGGNSEGSNKDRQLLFDFNGRLVGKRYEDGGVEVSIQYRDNINPKAQVEIDWAAIRISEISGKDFDAGFNVVLPFAKQDRGLRFDVKAWFSEKYKKTHSHLKTALNDLFGKKGTTKKSELTTVDILTEELLGELKKEQGYRKIELIFKYFDPELGMIDISITVLYG